MGGIGSGRQPELTELTITVVKFKRNNGEVVVSIHSNNSLFKGEFVCIETGDYYIRISRPILGDKRKKQKISDHTKNTFVRRFSFIQNHELPDGRLDIDQEDSDEDELWIYF